MATYSVGCSKVGSFNYAQYFTLYVTLNERDINSANNTSVVDYNVYCQSSGSGSINSKHFLYFSLGGNVIRNETVQVNVSSPNAYIGIASGSMTVTHDSSGNASLAFSAQIAASSYGVSASMNNTFTCATVPRYANITSFSVSKRDETSLKVNYSVDAILDYAWYSLNNGSSWNALPTSNVISGLTHGTTYNVKIKVRRADSQLTTESGNYSQSTYYYPHCTNSPNFVIGNPLTLTISNPLGRNISIYVVGADGTVQGGDTTTGTSISGYNNSTWVDWWYSTIPNSNKGTYQVQVKYGSITMTRSSAGTYEVTNSNPTFNNWEYEDVNSKTLALTGNNQIVIKGYSSIRGIVKTANKATGKNYATIKKYQLNIGGITKEKDFSNTETVQTDAITTNTNTFTMYAIDSRTNSTPVAKTISTSNYKEYTNISIDTLKTNATRLNKVGSQTTLNVEGTIWNNSFGKVQNAIDSFVVEYKSTNQTDEEYTKIVVGNPIVSGNVFKLNAVIQGDLGADGFTITDSFNIRVKVTDKLSPSTYVMTLGSGTPGIALHKNGAAINKPYDVDEGGALQVNGEIHSNGVRVLTESDGTGIPTESVIAWDGDTIPEGYEEVPSIGVIVKDSNGEAIKYPDGTMRVTQKFRRTLYKGSWKTWGTMSTYPIANMPNFPVSFTDAPIVSITLQASGYNAFMGTLSDNALGVPTTTKAGEIQVIRPTAVSEDTPIDVHIIAFGRWK